ncbi:MAG TPA: phage portal protein [Tepidisphaeraceae bacterium]|nr:phage portal protein [Tepidisphaeraceae bacterium]
MNPKNQIQAVHQAFTDIRADYAAAQPSRFRRTRRNLGGNADAHYYSEAKFLEMREYVRDMDRNDAIIGQAIDRAVANQIQGGFTLEPQTGDAKLDADLWARWDDWANDPEQCDLAGEHTFYNMEWHATRAELLDGDIFANLTDGGQVEMIEAHRCRTPDNTKRNVVHGVLLSDTRRREEFWFTSKDIDPSVRLSRVGDIVPYPVRDAEGNRTVCQVYNPTRISQTRGVTALHAVFDICGQFEDLNFAKLVQAQMVSCIGGFIERTADFQLGEREEETQSDGTTATIEGLSPGQILRGRPGEKFTTVSANVPNSEYFPHVKLLLQMIGLNLGLPLVLVLMDASETNFSGWRAAVDQARLGFKCGQQQRKIRFHRPVYLWKLREWMRRDPALRAAATRDGINLFAHKWNSPKWPYIQPEIEAEADQKRKQYLLVSPSGLQAERGGDFDDVVAETVRDNGGAIVAAIAKAQEIQQATGEKSVTWRDILFLSKDTGGTGGAPAGIDPAIEAIKQRLDTAGVATRAGVFTPQKSDEEIVRAQLGFPAMSPEVAKAWEKDEGTRRPITLTPPPGSAPAPVGGAKPPVPAKEQPESDDE